MANTPDVRSPERISYLFGQKIQNSFSPLLHQTIYDNLGLRWSQVLLDSPSIPLFLQLVSEARCFGASVTMPHKVAIIDYLDEITDECRQTGACNTVFIRRDRGHRRLIGANTDVVGIREAFAQNVINTKTFSNNPGMIVGAGGTARAAAYTLHKTYNCTPIYVVNRDVDEVEALISECQQRLPDAELMHISSVEQALSLSPPRAVVSAVPDFPPRSPSEVLAREIILTFLNKTSQGAWLEMAYHPNPNTALAKLADHAGWQVILGTEAMIYQGLEQDRYWTGLDTARFPLAAVKLAVAARLRKSAESSKL